MDVCIDEVQANNHHGSFLSERGYDNLIRKFNERTMRNYSRRQLKNRYDACRIDYSIWNTLLQNASSIGRDHFRKTIDAIND